MIVAISRLDVQRCVPSVCAEHFMSVLKSEMNLSVDRLPRRNAVHERHGFVVVGTR